MSSIRRSNLAISVVLFLVSLGLAYLGAQYLYPFEFFNLKRRVNLKLAGVEFVQHAGLHTLQLDHCQEGKFCKCVALIHGLGDSAQTWRKLFLRDRLDGVLWLAADLPGSGDSSPPSELQGYRVERMAEKGIQALKALPQCTEWMVVGNSLGGWVGAWMALKWPEGIRRLLLLASAGLLPPDRVSQAKLLEAPTVESLKEFQRKAYHQPRAIPERVWEQIVERAKKGNAKAIMSAQTERDYLNDKITAIQIPVMILWGLSDRVIPIEHGILFRELIPSAIFRKIEKCGHLPQKECPDVVEKSILELWAVGAM